jgi:hypothetical protein
LSIISLGLFSPGHAWNQRMLHPFLFSSSKRAIVFFRRVEDHAKHIVPKTCGGRRRL